MVGPSYLLKLVFVPSSSNIPLSDFQSAEPPVHVPTLTTQGRVAAGVGVAVGNGVGVGTADVGIAPAWGEETTVGVVPVCAGPVVAVGVANTTG